MVDVLVEGKKSSGQKLRDLLKRQDREADVFDDTPILDFTYADSESLKHEIAELYSYTEVDDFEQNYETFSKTSNGIWKDASDASKKTFVLNALDKLDSPSVVNREEACRCLLYLAQGSFKESTNDEEVEASMIENCLLLYNCGVFATVQDLLLMETENPEAAQQALKKPSICIEDSVQLRLLLNILYTILEVLRLCGNDSNKELQAAKKSLQSDLSGQMDKEPLPFAVHLFEMVLKFCAGSAPHYPIKKVLLMLWKVVLFTLGGFDHLSDMKKKKRTQTGLSPSFEDQEKTSLDETPHFELRSVSPSEGTVVKIEDEHLEMPFSPDRSLSSAASIEQFRKILLLRPKVRNKDVTAFLQQAREKFVGFQLPNDTSSIIGLPEPICDSIRVLQKHVYVSLSELQIKQEEEATARPFSKGKCELPETRAEIFYRSLLPNLPQYMIALLKIVLASAPTAKAKTDSINILTDVLPLEMPTTVVLSMQLGVDVNRHKEIIVKAISTLLLLLLKHLKINHIYQFEFVSQHLVFANCIPLILKFFNQNISPYITAKNNIPQLEFPLCVLQNPSEISPETLESGDTVEYCWRNLFSCINLLRILQKLTKWKHSRTMMLVVFKSAPILRRTLKVKEDMLQLYVLKLLKTQIKYLGRNWRKSNMKIVSLVYYKVRHRLNDDWAFGNDTDARPWDFQTEECSLRQNVDIFNYHHYEIGGTHYPPDLHPVDNDFHSCLNQRMLLSEKFKNSYEKWMEIELTEEEIAWEELLIDNVEL